MGRTRAGSSRDPVCGWTLDGAACEKRGEHPCAPRAEHVRAFFHEILVHTKGRFARRAFVLAGWQWEEIVRPLFGEVRWDTELRQYVRRYRVAWVELARKNGKSELLAGIALYLLCADGEEGAEVYSCAKDRDQARKVFDVALRMVQLSPVLSKRLTCKPHEKRIVDERTGSFYEAVAADAAGNLGHNPHGVIFDEVLTQPSADLWNAMRTGMGTRAQPMMAAATTAGDDPSSFAKSEHDECVKIVDDPRRAPHRFVFIRNMSVDADWTRIENYRWSNPALGDFLSEQSILDEIVEAVNDPAKENTLRQFRGNQWVSQTTRWMPLHLYDRSAGEIAANPDWLLPKLEGRPCYGGIDLSATTDLTALAWLFPGHTWQDPELGEVTGNLAIWRAWVPEAVVPLLDKHLGGQASVWVRDGWLTATEGDVIDYDAVERQIVDDAGRFTVMGIGHDRHLMEPLRQRLLLQHGIDTHPVGQGFLGISPAMKELMRQVVGRTFAHAGNPVARWNADSVEVKQDDAENIKPVKPARARSGKRIDLMAAALNAIDCQIRQPESLGSAYEDRGLEVV